MTARDVENILTSWTGKTLIGALIVAVVTMFFNLAYWTWQNTVENVRSIGRIEFQMVELGKSIGVFQAAQLAQRSIDDAQNAAISSIKADSMRMEQELIDHDRVDRQIGDELGKRLKETGK